MSPTFKKIKILTYIIIIQFSSCLDLRRDKIIVKYPALQWFKGLIFNINSSLKLYIFEDVWWFAEKRITSILSKQLNQNMH